MPKVRWTIDDREVREMLRKCKNKTIYRQLVNEMLMSLRDDVVSLTHVDTGQMKESWEVTPLKFKDSSYKVMGELINEAQKPWQETPYPSYELARGGSHDALGIALRMQEQKLNATIEETLEVLLK